MNRAKPCNAVETFCYDHIIADAVMKPAHDVLDEFVQELPRGVKVFEVGWAALRWPPNCFAASPQVWISPTIRSNARKRCPDATLAQGSALEWKTGHWPIPAPAVSINPISV